MKKERQLLLLITMAILNPNPGSPSRFSLGILQSSKIRLQVEVALIPSLSSFFPRDRPAMGLGTRNALIPWDRKKSVKYTDQMTCYSYIDFTKWDNFVLALCFWLLSVVAKTYKYDIKVMYKCRQQTDNLTPCLSMTYKSSHQNKVHLGKSQLPLVFNLVSSRLSWLWTSSAKFVLSKDQNLIR